MEVVLGLVHLRRPRRSRKLSWVRLENLRSGILNLFYWFQLHFSSSKEKGLLVMFLLTVNCFWVLNMDVMMFRRMICCH